AGPPALRADHGGHTRQQVAQVVGQVCVVPAGDALRRELAVAAERDVTQQVVAHRVHPVLGGQVGRRDLVDARIGHLLATQQQPLVHLHVGGGGQSGRHYTCPPTRRSGTG